MTFNISSYEAEGLGHVSTMQSKGFFGLMQMDTLIITPIDTDLPIYSYDRIKAMGNDKLYIEVYDTVINKPSFAPMDSVKQKYSDLPKANLGKQWYEDIRLPQTATYSGKRTDSDRFDSMALEYMKAFRVEFYSKDEKYNLCKIAFDPATGKYGEKVDTIFNAVAMGKSLTWPRPSYDGKYILFTLMDYGYFSIWHQESNQWLLNLQTGEARELKEINSEKADSYHNWNVNSHWIVFTSRRGDGLYSHLYLACVDDKGHFSKPFLLPQRHPKEYYEESIFSFNVPDFTKTKVVFDAYNAGREIASDQRVETKVK